MKYISHNIILKIAGEGPEAEKLKKLAEGDKRIEFLGFVPGKKLEELYSKALTVLFVPYDEDYGLITIEGMMSRKPVISTVDSGGPLEFITDGRTGYIVDPDPERIAGRINYLIENKKEAIQVGQNAYERVKVYYMGKIYPGTTGRLLDNLPGEEKNSCCIDLFLFPPKGWRAATAL